MKRVLVLLVSLFYCSAGSIFADQTGQWYDQNGRPVSDREVGEAFSQSFMQGALEQVNLLTPVFEKLKTCTPVSGNYVNVYGKKGGKCHFSYASYDCHVPMDVAQNFSNNVLKSLQSIKNGNFSTSSTSEESEYLESILSNQTYCRLK